MTCTPRRRSRCPSRRRRRNASCSSSSARSRPSTRGVHDDRDDHRDADRDEMASRPPLPPEPGQLRPDHRGAPRAGPPAGHARAARHHPGRRGQPLVRPVPGPGDGHGPAAAPAAEPRLLVARPGDGPARPDL